MPTRTMIVSAAQGHAIATRGLRKLPLSEVDVRIIADHLIDACLCGYPFAGLPRVLALARAYGDRPPPMPPHVTRETASSAVIDGGGTPGYVTVAQGAEIAIDKARDFGFAVVGINNSRFSGRSAYYVERIASAGLVALHVAADTAHVVPHGGTRAVLGTNPVAFAVPGRNRPVVFDMATSALTVGEVELAEYQGAELPAGVAVDGNGAPTTDPRSARRGAILPFGGHRGFGLSFMVQALCLLSGSEAVHGIVNDSGYLHVVFSPKLLMDVADYQAQVEALAELVRSIPAAGEHAVRVPSDRAVAERRRCLEAGFEVDRDVVEAIEAL